MTSSFRVWQPTTRDDDILMALRLLPLTAEQLLKWSRRFPAPFTSIHDVRRRLRKLSAAGLVRRWPLAIESRGSSPQYHKLTLQGFRFLKRDQSVRPERKRAFAPIGPALHHHTFSLSQFIVHAAVAAHDAGIDFLHPYPENRYRIEIGKESLLLDWRFSLHSGETRRNFNVELDNSTESILSTQERDSIGRKIRLLEEDDWKFQCFDPRRALTIFVTTRSRSRLQHILEAAGQIVKNANRTLIIGTFLTDFLQATDSLTTSCFLDHRGRRVALMPTVEPRNTAQALPRWVVATA